MELRVTEAVAEHPLIKSLFIDKIGCIESASDGTKKRPNGSDTFILMYCFSGKGWFQLADQKEVMVLKRTAVLINPGIPYSYRSDTADPWSFYFVYIRGEKAASYFEKHTSIHFLKQDELFSQCKQLLSTCYEVLKLGFSTQNSIYCSNLLGELLTLLLIFEGELPGKPHRESPVHESIQFMLDHIEGQVSLQQLCELTNISKPYFVNLFKKNIGYSPIDYFIRLKIQQSCEYLDSTDLPIKEISFKLAFSDPNYFSRMFSKIMGQPPTKYRHFKNS